MNQMKQMKQTRTQGLTLLLMGLLLLALTACAAQTPAATPTPTGPSGAELIEEMQKAIADARSAHLTMRFQVASAEGPVTGTAEVWAQRPGQRRIQLRSDLGSVDGILAVTAGDQGWAYSKRDDLVLVADRSLLQSQLGRQPELREIAGFVEKLMARGFTDTEAVNQGAATIAGRATYKVQVTFKPTADPTQKLEGIGTVFYIDAQTHLPQRVEIEVTYGNFTVRGFAEVQGEIELNPTLDAALFTFDPPPGAAVINLADVPLPSVVPAELPVVK